MMPSLFLVVLLLCALVRAETSSDRDVVLTPNAETDLRTLVEQLATKVQELQSVCENQERSQVAFSASLVDRNGEWTHLGPYNTHITLLFKKVTTNVGNAYNPLTGIFTAPVKGLYYIRFTGNVGNSGQLNAALMKNSEKIFSIYSSLGAYNGSGNGMTLVLEAGDQLSITLWNGNSIFDQGYFSTFSGFLVFPMNKEPQIVEKSISQI